MGKIKKLQDKGATILPLTVADAVLMNSADAGNLSTYLEALKSGVDFLLSIIGEDQAGDIFLKTKDGMPRGFYTEGFVSAGGKSTPEGGGGGGANLTQMWESLQGNSDTFANTKINKAHIPTLDVDHIPTLTTGKISDFVSATQAIANTAANTAVVNKADKATTLEGYGIKDAVKLINNSADDVRNTSAGFAHISQGTKWGGGLWTVFSSDKTAGIQINANAWANKTLATRIYNNSTGTWHDWHEVAFKETTLSGYGITDAVTLNTDQTISGEKTFSNFKVSNTNLVTNLNAEMVGGLHASDFWNSKAGNLNVADIDVFTTRTSGTYRVLHEGHSSALFVFRDENYIWNSLSSLELYATHFDISKGLKVRTSIDNNRYSDWKTVAFTDTNSLTPSGETLTINGNLITNKVTSKSLVSFIGNDNTERIALQNNSSNDLLIGGGYTDRTVYLDANIFRSRANTTVLGGKVGIGTDSPTARLHVNGDSIINGKLTVATGALKIVAANLSYDLGTLIVDKSLKVIGTMSATQGEFANYIKIGNATISWNAQGGYLEINEGLASHKFISAGGVVTGDAGGGAGGLSLTDMWVSLNGNIDAYGKSKIHIDHIPLDVILSHDSYENDVASRINTFNYSNSSSFTSAVKALIVANNIPTLEMSKINGLEDTLTDIGTVVQSNYETLNTLITNNHNDHEARIKAIEQALTWQTV